MFSFILSSSKTAALANKPPPFLKLTSPAADVLTPLTCVSGRPKRKGAKKKKMPYYNTADRSSLNSHLNYKNIRPCIRAIAFFNAEWPQFSPLGEHSVYFPASWPWTINVLAECFVHLPHYRRRNLINRVRNCVISPSMVLIPGGIKKKKKKIQNVSLWR